MLFKTMTNFRVITLVTCVLFCSYSFSDTVRVELNALTQSSTDLISMYEPHSSIRIQAQLLQGGVLRAYLPDGKSITFNNQQVRLSLIHI